MKQAIFAIFAAASATAVLAADGPKKGLWEYQQETVIPGMSMPEGMQMPELPEGMQLPPGMSMPKMSAQGMTQTLSYQRCVTDDSFVPMDEDADNSCKMTRMDRDGNRFSWAAECQTEQGPASAQGEGVYTGESMNATIRSRVTINGKPMEMTQKINGRYVGPCSGN